MYTYLLINVDELWLKGKNRKLYFQAILSHIKNVIKKTEEQKFSIRNQNQRLVAEFNEAISDKTIESLLNIPGVHSIIPSLKVPLTENLNELLSPLDTELSEINTLTTFKVETSRTLKNYPKNSMEISRYLGHMLLKKYEKLKVDVKKPEIMVNVRILSDGIFLSTKKFMGMGGLPWGTSGSLVTLLSGGFDSPVASYLMSKRGCKQTFVFFHAYPFVGDDVKDKIIELSKVLAKYQKSSQLYIVPFGDIQVKIGKTCQEEYRTIFFRKLMVEVSNYIAKKVSADAILTGDSLGQVSSQTIGNISLMEGASQRPIFRPLLGFNKIEIINLSRKVGTHDISIIPHDDACSLFAPKSPIIRPDRKYWREYFEENDFSEEISGAFEKSEILTFDSIGREVKPKK